ncbi:MAG: helix-turn-helix transcriptional regulator [Deltaproteobacteria bacterium]|nr:helix-turn-helix transcriptional regulator [Deltaproteobacteria bacterium]
MRRTTSVEEFTREPFGRILVGTTSLIWCADSSHCGAAYWGSPSVNDLRFAFGVWDNVVWPRVISPVHVVSDFLRLERADDDVFRLFADHVNKWEAGFVAAAARHAVIRPMGMLGSVVTGFLPLFGAEHEFHVFADAGAAFSWLEWPGAAKAHDEIERALECASGTPHALRRFREQLEESLDSPDVDRIAESLACSRRTLQRDLFGFGTSFREELQRARVRVASGLLRDTDQKLSVIATRVGCSSLSHFGALFRQQTGETPSAFRARHRS